eukprot:CAMPEP_0170566132 /NCGR_PEP_ID=MMETSP0211-20121228/79642_1 /TAXON_ID=311385 /ORGANISM="Pseudokeronopsis sp., Strain OXSARD2" /LENGTH=70 /DNA_ID=CAMNT_0010887221 /DNA_START=214 /DNA_END=426 /DNA_ORIENTATION=+
MRDNNSKLMNLMYYMTDILIIICKKEENFTSMFDLFDHDFSYKPRVWYMVKHFEEDEEIIQDVTNKIFEI